jgi:predicted porin
MDNLQRPARRITLCLAALCAGPAMAQSSVELYGIADIGLDYVNNQNGGANRYLRSGNVSGSRIGFRGSEDLGGGTRAVYVLESGFSLDTGELSSAGTLFSRQAYAGLSDTRAGTLTAGRQYTPYYWFVGSISAPALMGGSFGARPGDIDGLDQALRINNSLSYTSPAWSGLQLGLLAGAGESAGSTARGGAYSVAVRYKSGAWQMALAHQVLKNGASRTGWDPQASASFNRSAVNTGYLSAAAIRYTAAALQHESNGLTVGSTVSSVSYRPDAGSRFADSAIFNGADVHLSYAVYGPLTLGATYNYTRESGANGITDPARYRQLSLSQTYALSKRTRIYLLEGVQWARGQTLGANGRAVAAVAGVGDAQTSTPSSGGQQLMLSLGLRHAF